ELWRRAISAASGTIRGSATLVLGDRVQVSEGAVIGPPPLVAVRPDLIHPRVLRERPAQRLLRLINSKTSCASRIPSTNAANTTIRPRCPPASPVVKKDAPHRPLQSLLVLGRSTMPLRARGPVGRR